MRLRSRTSTNKSDLSSNGMAPEDRSVLGDVSNRKRNAEPSVNSTKKVKVVGNDVKKPRALTRLASALNPYDAVKKDTEEISNTVDDENEKSQTNVGQRRSRRVKDLKTTGRGKRKNESLADEKKGKNLKIAAQDMPQYVNADAPQGVEKIDSAAVKEDALIPKIYRMRRDSYDGKNHTTGVAPHDQDDTGNVLQVTEYVSDLFQHLYASETTSYPSMYMASQRDINAKMRAILVDWLVEVHMKFRLVPDTLYLCVNIIDRYCSKVPVPRNKLQLVGVTALLIACKYEEIYPPEVRDCVYITDRAYRREEVLAMEQDILKRLNYQMSVPTGYPFILRFLQIAKVSPLTRAAANYYMERTLQEHDLLRFRPSLVSAAAVLLALNNPDILVKENLDPSVTGKYALSTKLLLKYTGFKLDALKECAAIIAQKVGEEPVTASRRQLVSVKRKYDNRRFHHVSSTVNLPHAYFLQYFDDPGCSKGP